MEFASGYLENKALEAELFPDKPANNTCIIITIPAFDESGIIFTLDSLCKCDEPPCAVEVIVLLNAPAVAGPKQLQRNTSTREEIREWNDNNCKGFIRVLVHDTGVRNERDWGVGMARKVAMDEAVRRFNTLKRNDGVIVSLDADCLVSHNYLTGIYDELYLNQYRNGCSIYFEHPFDGNMSDEHYNAIVLYELHLRYYYQAIRYSGFPGVYHTIGSALAVKAEAYVKSGGMNRRQGAEDFYFIQKLLPAGGFFYLNTVTVYPSPRVSGRVPFGTGPVINDIISSGKTEYLTYNPVAFGILKSLFEMAPYLYEAGESFVSDKFEQLSYGLKEFLNGNDWINRLDEIRRNTSSSVSFQKRFFNWFNMFRVVKYLNFMHSGGYLKKIPVVTAANEMLILTDQGKQSTNTTDLLNIYRNLER